MKNSTGVILAGGASTRMGQSKALLQWRGFRLADYVANLLKKAGISDVYASGHLEGFINIPDLTSGKGPMGGICACLNQLQHQYHSILFIPVDMPLLSEACLRYLINIFDSDLKGYDGAFYEGHPLPCILRMNGNVVLSAGRIQNHLAQGGTYSVWRFLSNVEGKSISVPGEHVPALTNVNTPNEWRKVSYEYTTE